ncbi:glycosyltransferase family 9 protein [Azospirillum sp.]|uniref:tetratricopeptide repeat protein n=1 Tax=Azospirillum sp. TaxID=34012 RepID=UPI003D706D8C
MTGDVGELLRRGVEHHRSGRPIDAARLYCLALMHQPAEHNALHLLGLLLKDRGHADHGLRLIGHALRVAPAQLPALVNAARVHVLNERPAAALPLLKAAAAVAPDHAEALLLLGRAWYAGGQPDDHRAALRIFLRVCRLAPGQAAGWVCAAHPMIEFERDFARAKRHAAVAIALEPADPAALTERASARSELGNHRGALRDAGRALRINADTPFAGYVAGFSRLCLGDWNGGLPGLEQRVSRLRLPARHPELEVWDGRPLDGETALVLFEEAGLGDTLQFVRYLPAVRRLCRNVVVVCRAGVEWIVRQVPGSEGIAVNPPQLPARGRKALFMSLPLLLGAAPDRPGAPVPYVAAPAADTAHWAGRLRGVNGFRVGIVWDNSAPDRPADIMRVLPFPAFERLAAVPGVRLVSLQKADTPQKRVPEHAVDRVVQLPPDYDAGPDAMRDAAAVVANLDLVITMDSGIAHLAGAMGRPVWLVLAHRACWRWMDDRETTPWYPTMRVFRQERPGDWDGVFTRIAAALTDAASGRALAGVQDDRRFPVQAPADAEHEFQQA